MGELAALIAAIGWGISAVTVQKGVKKITPLEGAFIATLINVIVIVPLMLIMFMLSAEAIPDFGDDKIIKGIYLFLLAGLFSVLSGKVLSFQSISYIGSNRTTQIRQMEPVFGVFIGVVFLQEQLSGGQWAGIGMVLAGIVYLVYENGFFQKQLEDKTGSKRLGVSLAITAGLGFAVSKAIRKTGLDLYPSALVASALNSLGAIFFLFILLLLSPRKKLFINKKGSILPYVHFFVLSGLFSSVANLSMSWALLSSEVSTVVVIGSTTPFFTLLINRLIHPQEEKINLKLIITGVLIVCGVSLLAVYGRSYA